VREHFDPEEVTRLFVCFVQELTFNILCFMKIQTFLQLCHIICTPQCYGQQVLERFPVNSALCYVQSGCCVVNIYCSYMGIEGSAAGQSTGAVVVVLFNPYPANVENRLSS
jgi:hypothetical protein